MGFSFGVLVVCLCKGCDGCSVCIVTRGAVGARIFRMMSVSLCKCCIFVSCVHPLDALQWVVQCCLF